MKLLTGVLLLMSAALFSGQVRAVETDQSANQSTEYLKLPGYELYPPADVSGIKVGDALDYSLQGFELPVDAELVPAPGSKPFMEQGFSVTKVDATHIRLVPLKGGKNQLSAIVIKSAQNEIARTFPVYLFSESAIQKDDPEKDKLVDFKPPMDLQIPRWLLFIVGILVFLIIVGLVFGIIYYVKSRQAKRALATLPRLPEDVEALEALNRLQSSDFVKTGQFKRHYFKVSEILKTYLARRYSVDAQECTSEELVRLMEEKAWKESKHLDQLETLFKRMDIVKFTDQVPDPKEAAWIIDEAKALVNATKRMPVSDASRGAE